MVYTYICLIYKILYTYIIPLDCEGGEEAVDERLEGDAFPCNACRRCKRRRLI